MANIITIIRILISVLLIFIPVLSPCFYVVYVICGLTDMTDGFIARKTNKVSKNGAILDSIADIIFVTVCLIKILPVVTFPIWLWIWVGAIALIRGINVVCGYFFQHKLVLLHTRANKLTGLLLFLIPLTLKFIELKYSVIPVCFIATFAAIQEGHFIRKGIGN